MLGQALTNSAKVSITSAKRSSERGGNDEQAVFSESDNIGSDKLSRKSLCY